MVEIRTTKVDCPAGAEPHLVNTLPVVNYNLTGRMRPKKATRYNAMAETLDNVRHVTITSADRDTILKAADGFVTTGTVVRKLVMDLYAKWEKLNWDTGKDKLNASASRKDFFHDIDPQYPLNSTELAARAKSAGIPTNHKGTDGKMVEDLDSSGAIPYRTNMIQRYYPRYNFFAYITRKDRVVSQGTGDRDTAKKRKARVLKSFASKYHVSRADLHLLIRTVTNARPNEDGKYKAVDTMVDAAIVVKATKGTRKATKPSTTTAVPAA